MLETMRHDARHGNRARLAVANALASTSAHRTAALAVERDDLGYVNSSSELFTWRHCLLELVSPQQAHGRCQIHRRPGMRRDALARRRVREGQDGRVQRLPIKQELLWALGT